MLCIAAGCTPIPYLPEEPPPETTAEADDQNTTVPDQAQAEQPAAAIEPTQPARSARQLQPPRSRVLVLRSSGADNYREVAAALGDRLGNNYALHEVDLSEPGIRAAITRTNPSAWSGAIAIGEEAAEFAASELDIVTVFCQIFDYAPLLESHDNLFGVEPLPPLNLQLQSWQRLSPDTKTVGLIVSQDQRDLADEARAVAAELGIELRTALALTDQDAIYQFKRFAQAVDALWLYPSRQILSPGSIQEILDYALDHQVQTIVFNKSLLDWGALLSVGSNTEDIAASAASMLDELVRGGGTTIGRMRPLTTVETHLNEETARKLGMPDPAPAEPQPRLLTAIDNDS